MIRHFALILALGTFAAPTLASADTSVIVLGIRSVEGDDEVSRNLTGALRRAASQVPGWQIADAEVSLAQMSMVHGCDEPDAACMAEIARELGQQRIIYGTIRRTGAGSQYDFALTLYFFNSESGQIEDSLTDNIPRVRSDIDDLRGRAARYIAQFSGQARYGSVRLNVNRPGASVTIDGEPVGVTNDRGVLIVEDVPEGQRMLTISADGYETFSGAVRVVADEQSEFRANLVAERSADLGWLPGVALIGAGALSLAIGTFTQWLPNRRDRQAYADLRDACNSDDGCPPDAVMNSMTIRTTGGSSLSRDEFYGAMALVAGNGGNACSATTIDRLAPGDAQSRARHICDQQDRRKLLAIVFNLVGLAAVGTGAALLFSWLGKDGDEAGTPAALRLQLSPLFSRREAGLAASLEF